MDSPKHLVCLDYGLPGQYYRIAGSTKFKCKSCGNIAEKDSFEAVEFEWKDNPDTWKTWKNEKDKVKLKEKVK